MVRAPRVGTPATENEVSILERVSRTATGLRASLLAGALLIVSASVAAASEAELVIPDLSATSFGGINGRSLLMAGVLVCIAGLAFGVVMFQRVRDLPVHESMADISKLIYETCKTYLITQGKFLMLLEVFVGAI